MLRSPQWPLAALVLLAGCWRYEPPPTVPHAYDDTAQLEASARLALGAQSSETRIETPDRGLVRRSLHLDAGECVAVAAVAPIGVYVTLTLAAAGSQIYPVEEHAYGDTLNPGGDGGRRTQARFCADMPGRVDVVIQTGEFRVAALATMMGHPQPSPRPIAVAMAKSTELPGERDRRLDRQRAAFRHRKRSKCEKTWLPSEAYACLQRLEAVILRYDEERAALVKREPASPSATASHATDQADEDATISSAP